MGKLCLLVDAWLIRSLAGEEEITVADQLVDHVHRCPRCRGALLVLATELVGASAGPVDLPCEASAERISAFVDYERRYGLIAAVQTLPDIWWHTLACPDCDEIYAELRELADLPAEPWQLAVVSAQPKPKPKPQHQLRLRPSLVRQLLRTEQRWGVAWGSQRADVFITDQQAETSRLRLYLRCPSPSEIALVVRTEPALAGTAVLTVAGETYSAALDRDGSAVFTHLAADLFGGDESMDLTVTMA